MELFQRAGSPFWWCDFSDPRTKKRVRFSTKRTAKREAERVAAAELAKRLDQAQFGKKPDITVAEVVRTYADHLAARGAASARNRTTYLEALAAWLGPNRTAASVSAGDLNRRVRVLTEQGLSASRIRHEVAGFITACRLVEEEHAVPDLSKVSLPEERQKTRWLTMDEAKRVMAEMDPARPVAMPQGGFRSPEPGDRLYQERVEARDLFVVLLMTGGRLSEALSLRWDQIDFERRTIALWGRKTQTYRSVPLLPEAEAVLRRRQEQAAPGARYVFPAPRSEQERARRFAPDAMRAAFERAGLNAEAAQVDSDGRATAHSLRHTYASWLLQREVPMAVVADLLGHSSVRMSERYAHLARGQAHNAAFTALSSVALVSPEPGA